MSIGFVSDVRFMLEERQGDPEGHYLFPRGRLMEFNKGGIIIAGDFNFCIDPGLHSTSRGLKLVESADGCMEATTHETKRLHITLPCTRDVLKYSRID